MKYPHLRITSHKILALCFIIITWGAVELELSDIQFTQPSFFIEKTNIVNAKNPEYKSELISNLESAAHSATIIRLNDSSLLAMWFAGSREGSKDVKVYSATYQNNHWSEPKVVITPKMVSSASNRFTSKLGNPVLSISNDGHALDLFIVGVAYGGWSISHLEHFRSLDNGTTWNIQKRLSLSPFFNISSLVRTNSVALDDGGFYLPVYQELFHKYPELLRFDANGNLIKQIRLSSVNHLIQPAIIATSKSHAFVWFRNTTSDKSNQPNPIFMSETNDGGETWSSLKATNLDNPNSSIAVTRYSESQFLLVYNPDSKERSRDKLSLAISSDGINWQHIYDVENHPTGEYSYPSIISNGDVFDLVYTFNRKQIKHVRFNNAFLKKVITDVSSQ